MDYIYLKSIKSKIELRERINSDELMINTRYEKIKDGEIIIELKNEVELWNYLEKNLISNIYIITYMAANVESYSKQLNKELTDESKLRDTKIKDKIEATKDVGGVVDKTGSFDLKKFNSGVDNQGRRDMLINAMKTMDSHKVKVDEAKLQLDSRIKKIKETLELQKRYYQLVPRPNLRGWRI